MSNKSKQKPKSNRSNQTKKPKTMVHPGQSEVVLGQPKEWVQAGDSKSSFSLWNMSTLHHTALVEMLYVCMANARNWVFLPSIALPRLHVNEVIECDPECFAPTVAEANVVYDTITYVLANQSVPRRCKPLVQEMLNQAFYEITTVIESAKTEQDETNFLVSNGLAYQKSIYQQAYTEYVHLSEVFWS